MENIEIELKFLADIASVKRMEYCVKHEIEQIYLCSDDLGVVRLRERVRPTSLLPTP